MSVLEDYETATELTRRMREAARLQDWDKMAALGAQRDSVFAALPRALPAMSARDGAKMAQLIGEMLACHAEITDRASPWLEHAATLLAAFDRAGNTPATP